MKGISQIASVAVLLGIAVSVAGLYAEWAPRYSENVTSEVASQTNTDLKCGNAAISIQDPVYDKTGNRIIFDLYNSGTIRFTKKIEIAAFNNSLIVNRTTVEELEVGEKEKTEIVSNRIVERVVASSTQCQVEDDETLIRVQK